MRRIEEVWKRIETKITMDTPEKPGLFLGCHHWIFEVPCPDSKGEKIDVIEWDMEDQIRQAVNLRKDIVGTLDGKTLKKAQLLFCNTMVEGDDATSMRMGPWFKCLRYSGHFDEGAAIVQEVSERARANQKEALTRLLDDEDVKRIYESTTGVQLCLKGCVWSRAYVSMGSNVSLPLGLWTKWISCMGMPPL